MEPSFSARLLLHPLFQGFSRLDFLDIVGATPFDFRSFSPKATLVHQGEPCVRLHLLLRGTVEIVRESPNRLYSITEELTAPCTIGAARLYGLHNLHTHTVKAVEEVQCVLLDKPAINQLQSQHPAFRMNFLNAISTDLQHFETKLWNTRQEDTESRFAEFLRNRCIRPVGRKKLHIKMEDLATELGVTRLKVSKMLANMEEKQWLTYTRGNITVKALELLGY